MRRFFVIAALIGLLVSCREPDDGPPDVIDPDQKTTIVFDNTQGICAVTVYSSYPRNEENKITQISAGRLSQEFECYPGPSVPFFLSYQINFKGISGFTVDFVPPENAKNQIYVRVDPNIKTTIPIPPLAEALASPDTLLSRDSYLLIQNNSSYPIELLRNSSIVNPDNISETVVNSGERAQYTVNAGGTSAYNLMVGGDTIPFPGSLISFEAGRVYSFTYSNGVLSLTSEVELKLENAAVVSPNKPVPQAPGAPVITASDRFLTVRWTAVEDAESYEVYISTAQNPPAQPVKTMPGTVTVLTELTNKTAYYVWVKAVNENGASDLSPRARGIPWPINEVPAVPGRPVIIPGINQLTVNWEECGGASSYEVYVNTTSSAPVEPVTTSDKTSAVINNLGDGNILENGVIYYIWVRAVNNAGKSGYSPVEAGTPSIPTVAPAAPGIPVLSAGNREIAVSWQAVELAASYEVWFGTSSNSAQAQKFGGDIVGGVTETIITGLTNETTYYVWIKAKNVVGTSDFSPSANVTLSAFAVLPETPETPTIISGNRELTISWTAVEGALFYEVWTGMTSNSANAEKYGADISGTSTTLTELINGTTYYIWIKAKNNIGISGFSPVASGIPSASDWPPLSPQNAPVVTSGNGELALSWQAVEGASAYEIWMGTTINPTTASKRGDDVSALSVTITGLTNEITYYVWIKAKNSVGTSGFSPMASGMPMATPGNLTVSAADQQITISWPAVSGATSYEVYYSTTTTIPASPAYTVTELSRTFTGLTNGTMYYFWVKAVHANGTSDASPMANGKPLGTPGMPTLTPGQKQLRVSWTAVAGADEYEVYYGTDTPATLAVTTAGTSATITGLVNGTTYHVRLRTKNANGVSDYGPSVSNVPNVSPGLYRNNEKIGDQNLSAALSYISANSVDGDDFYIVLGADESVSPTTLDYFGETVGITLLGYGGERTITLNSNGSLFTINTGVTLTLDENITLVGLSTNYASLIYVDSRSTLIMNTGAKISGNTGYGVYNNGTFTMHGGKISDTGGGVSNGDGLDEPTFTMYGGEISGNTGYGVGNGGTFTMHGGTISGNTGNGVGNGGTFTMHGGTISGNTDNGVGNYGTFTMNDGTISENTSGEGGGVNNGGTFTMNGGEISGNTANTHGGGIVVWDVGTFTMNGGEISGNTAAGWHGGGIYVAGGTITINGGEISGNTAYAFGGGISIPDFGTVTMHGGIISRNTAGYCGGGISVESGTVTMHGGVINGNTANAGGGIYVSSGTFKKLPSGSGQNSGIIYGNEETGVDADGVSLRNTDGAVGSFYSSSQRRNTTAGQTDHIDSTTGRGLSANGEPPYGE